MDAGTLHDAIAEVSPITSCSVGKADDRSTWTWVPQPGATQPQIDAGNNVIATIPIDPLTTVTPGVLVTRFTNGEYKQTLDYHTSSLAAGTIGPKKTWDTMIREPDQHECSRNKVGKKWVSIGWRPHSGACGRNL